MRYVNRLLQLMRTHWMPTISAFAALLSMCLVPPDDAYLSYFDWKTLGCLFCVLAIACALRNAGVFDWAARASIRRFARPRSLVMTLVLTTAAFSMLFTNDVALVIMLPLTVAILVRLDAPQLMPATFAMQALSANLCGMITPFGNPQNLYVFSYYHVELLDFLAVMALPFALSTVGVVVVTALLARRFSQPRGASAHETPTRTRDEYFDPEQAASLVDARRLIVYAPLFVVILLSVFRVVPIAAAVALTVLALVIVDRSALLKVDYALLVTFVCFFVFAGNMARIPALADALRPVMDGWGLPISALSSQVISNVPAAVLLSHFTEAWQPLLVGVNIGGAGTFVGSLASLIVIRHYMIARDMIARMREPDAPSTKELLRLFGALNAAFFATLLCACQLIQMLWG